MIIKAKETGWVMNSDDAVNLNSVWTEDATYIQLSCSSAPAAPSNPTASLSRATDIQALRGLAS